MRKNSNYPKNQQRKINRGRNNSKQPRKDSSQKRVNYDNTRVDKFEKDEREIWRKDSKKGEANDIAWYSKNPELMKSAASLPFGYITGQSLPWGGNESAPPATTLSVPGVMTLAWVPSYGGDNIQALNQAAQSIYSYVVHANSRNQSYDPNDLMLIIQAGKEVFSCLAAMIRAYGTMKTFAQRNAYYPKVMLAAMGFDYNDLVKNYSKMWFDINELIARSTQIWLPNNIPMITRQFWLNTNVYTDGSDIKSQMYVFTQAAYYKYVETGTSTGGCLAQVTLTDQTGVKLFTPGIGENNVYTWDQWKTVINDMFSALLDSQDRGIMFGDILKAYGKEMLYSIQEITSDYKVTPVYNQEVLTQIENATVNANKYPAGLRQNPSSNTLEEYYYMTVAANDKTSAIYKTAQGRTVLNFHNTEDPTSEMVMIATRLHLNGVHVRQVPVVQSLPKNGSEATFVDKYLALPASTGTEMCIAAQMWMLQTNTLNNITQQLVFSYSVPTNVTSLSNTATYSWAAFDWAPWLYVIPSLTNDPELTGRQDRNVIANYAIGDYDQYTILQSGDLLKLHTSAVYSEYGVPVL